MSDQNSEYPRVLVIATISFNLEAGGGVTMTNLFRGWPKDRIAQIYNSGVKNKDTSVCRSFYRVPSIDRQLAWTEGRQLLGASGLSRALRRFGAHKLLRIPHEFQEAIAFAREFKPDVAYIRPLDKPSSSWWFGRALCRVLGIPYVTHIMDDWPARYADDTRRAASDSVPTGLRGRLKSRRLARELQQTVRDASSNIAISPEMASAFGERYDKPFQAFHNTVDVDRWESRCAERPLGRPGHDRPFLIRYIGAVVPDKELHSFLDIARAVENLQSEGRRVEIELHCGPAWAEQVDRHLDGVPHVRRGAFLTQDQLPLKLSQADLLILPINFDARSVRYVGYSMQTKGPEYMASGTPILVYGPPSNPNVRYARDARWAVVIDRQDESGSRIADEIRMLMDNPDRATRIGLHGRSIAKLNHDVSVVRERFQQTLRDAARSQPAR